MDILISTNMYRACEFEKVFDILDEIGDKKIGVEVFPMFHDGKYEEILARSLGDLSKRSISFHGPYYDAEYSCEIGTLEYEKSIYYFKKTLKYAEILKSKYLVFHHNNCRVTEDSREKRITSANENLLFLKELSNTYKIPLVIENAGVKEQGSMLFNEEEFITLCQMTDNPVLLDIGHANANGWNLRNVMKKLGDQVISYHIHNNDGYHDCHSRILDGTLDFKQFISDYKELTPNADLVMEYSAKIGDQKNAIIDDIRILIQKFRN